MAGGDELGHVLSQVRYVWLLCLTEEIGRNGEVFTVDSLSWRIVVCILGGGGSES